MQAQDEASVFLLKLWPRIEANKNRIIIGIVVIAVVVFVGWVFAVQSEQKQVEAGEKLTQLIMTPDAKPEAFLKIADDYAGTQAAQRALLEAAQLLFVSGQFENAQTQFQNFLDNNPNSDLAANAALGVAASLDAQNKTDLAAAAYQRVFKNYTDVNAANVAKLNLAKIDEAQGRYNNAMINYQDVAQQSLISSLRQEAMLRLMELKNKMPVATTALPSPAPAVSPISPAK